LISTYVTHTILKKLCENLDYPVRTTTQVTVVRTNTGKKNETNLKRKVKMTELVSKTMNYIIEESEHIKDEINVPNVCGALVAGYCVFVVFSLFNI